MQTQIQTYYWNTCVDCSEYACEDKFTIDLYISDQIVELTREDLKSMLNALDEREGS